MKIIYSPLLMTYSDLRKYIRCKNAFKVKIESLLIINFVHVKIK